MTPVITADGKMIVPDPEHPSKLVMYCAGIPELVENWERLTGLKLICAQRRAPLDQMIDCATGHNATGLKEFADFVYDCIWCRLPKECFEFSSFPRVSQ